VDTQFLEIGAAMPDAPTKQFCRKAINEKGGVVGFSLGVSFQSQCKRYYAEFRD